jgi:hypothetical protein
MLLRRRSRRAAAVVGLVAGLALLLGAVLDGGMGTPTRADLLDGAVAATVDGHPVAAVAPAREDHPAWGTTLPMSRIALVATAPRPSWRRATAVPRRPSDPLLPAPPGQGAEMTTDPRPTRTLAPVTGPPP